MPALPSLQPLYLVTDGGRLRAAGRLLEQLAAALRGARGAIGFVQLREKGAEDVPPAERDELCRLIPEVGAICELHGATFLLNGGHDPRALGLCDSGGSGSDVPHGMQVGGTVAAIAEARRMFRRRIIVGYSAHSSDEAEAAALAGADLVLLAPVFTPLSKTGSAPPLGLDPLREAASRVEVPLYALGGITVERVPSVAETGVTGVAAITAFFPADGAPFAESIEARSARLAAAWFESRKELRAKP